LSRLFEPYYRGENAGTRPGEGLGLYTAKKDAEAIGARLTVDSVLGKGSHFTLTLPTA
jgi:signal transduction histidine kinase